MRVTFWGGGGLERWTGHLDAVGAAALSLQLPGEPAPVTVPLGSVLDVSPVAEGDVALPPPGADLLDPVRGAALLGGLGVLGAALLARSGVEFRAPPGALPSFLAVLGFLAGLGARRLVPAARTVFGIVAGLVGGAAAGWWLSGRAGIPGLASAVAGAAVGCGGAWLLERRRSRAGVRPPGVPPAAPSPDAMDELDARDRYDAGRHRVRRATIPAALLGVAVTATLVGLDVSLGGAVLVGGIVWYLWMQHVRGRMGADRARWAAAYTARRGTVSREPAGSAGGDSRGPGDPVAPLPAVGVDVRRRVPAGSVVTVAYRGEGVARRRLTGRLRGVRDGKLVVEGDGTGAREIAVDRLTWLAVPGPPPARRVTFASGAAVGAIGLLIPFGAIGLLGEALGEPGYLLAWSAAGVVIGGLAGVAAAAFNRWLVLPPDP